MREARQSFVAARLKQTPSARHWRCSALSRPRERALDRFVTATTLDAIFSVRALLIGAVAKIVRCRRNFGQLPGQLGLLRFPRFSKLADTQLERAHRRLRAKSLLGVEGDALSLLLPGTGRLLLRAGYDAEVCEVAISEATGLAALHARVYRLRPDAGAVAIVTTPSSAAVSGPGGHIPILFDEQARHIGEAWPSTNALSLEAALASGANAGAVDGRWLVIGVTPSRMVFNVELFEKSA